MPVVSVTASQTIDAAGTLQDTYEIVYTIPGKPGSFTLNVPQTGDAVAAAKEAIDAQSATVNAIYQL